MAMYGFDLDVPDSHEVHIEEQVTVHGPVHTHICDESCLQGCERKFVASYIPRWARPHYALFPESPFACPMCYDDTCTSTDELNVHMDSCNITDQVVEMFKDGIEITCRVRKVHPMSDRQSMCVQYEDIVIKEDTASCPVCGIGASSLDLLLPHLDVHECCGLCKWYYICTSCYMLSNTCHNYQTAIRHYAKLHGQLSLQMKTRDFFARHHQREFSEFMANANHEYIVWYP